MLHPKIIARLKDAIELRTGIKLVEYPVDKSIKVYEHFQSITASDGKKKWYQRPGETAEQFRMANWEAEWIRNELSVCRCSFEYWFYRYFFLKDKENVIRRPDVLIAHQIALDILREIDGKQLPKILMFLKARQLGISTLVEAMILWIALFRKGSHCIISSAEEEKSVMMSEMVWICLENLPLWMQPKLTRDDRAKGPEFGYIDSDILIQHGSQTKGIGRGSTVIAAHVCLRGDSFVDVGNGNLTRIDEMQVGDAVMTHSGERARISAITRRPSEGRRIVEVRSWLNKETLTLTEDHKVFTKRGWVPAGELTQSDWLGTPIRRVTKDIEFLITPRSIDKWGRVKCGKTYPMRFPMNRETGFAVGYYLAEGSLGYNPEGPSQLTFALNKSEYRYAERAAEALRPFATSTKIKNRPGTKTAILSVHGTSLARFFYNHFGKTETKVIPEWVFSAGHEFLEGIVAGYFSGDGSKSNVGHGPSVQATSVRPRLLYQMRHILAALSIGWGGITTEKAFVDHRGWNNKKSWTLIVNGESASRLYSLMGIERKRKNIRDFVKKYSISDGFVWTRVRSVSESSADEVWDLEVDHPDHDFETVLGIVANSEVSWYPDPVGTIESSLLKAMHESSRTFLVLESTARKKGDWFHRTWEYNRSLEAEGKNKFTCIFLPWYVGKDKYPTEDWLRNHPIPPNWKPSQNTLKQANNANLYVASTPLLKKYMGEKWRMPIEQQWFYEFEYEQASRSDETLKSFLAEMASDEREAFQSKRWSVYDIEVIDRLQKRIEEETPEYTDYAFTGNGIEPRFQLKEFQSQSAKRVVISASDMEGNPLEWKLVPLRETPDDERSFYVRIWEMPKKGYNYTIAIDVAGGVGEDATVIDVLRVGKDWEPDVQVAQLWCPWLSSVEIPPFCHALGILYGRHMSPIPEALMCPELVLSTGDAISHQLSLKGYTNWHYERKYDRSQNPGTKGRMRGWATRTYTRQLMLETLKMMVDQGWVIINSERTVEQLANQESEETDSGKTKWDHADGEHDDCIFSLGIAVFCSHDAEALVDRQKKKPKAKAEVEHPEVQENSAEAWIAKRFAKEDSDFIGEHDEDDIPVAW